MKYDDTAGPMTEEAFARAVTALVQTASENGVAVLGGWECRSPTGTDYEIVIVELADE
jgi:acyl-CoA reductase-like NAD-dependent aldehyde dehydrogenase